MDSRNVDDCLTNAPSWLSRRPRCHWPSSKYPIASIRCFRFWWACHPAHLARTRANARNPCFRFRRSRPFLNRSPVPPSFPRVSTMPPSRYARRTRVRTLPRKTLRSPKKNEHRCSGENTPFRNCPLADEGCARRTFVVGMTEYAEVALVERLTELLRQQSDSIDLRLRSIAKVEYLELLDEGGIDAFVGHADEVPPRFLSASLLKDPLVLLARRGHPIFKTQIGMEDLVKWPQILVSPTGEARGAVDPILKRKGVERRVALTVGTYLGIPLALQNSDLTSNVPQQIAARLSKVLPLRSAPLPFRHVVASELVWHSRNEADHAQSWLRGLIRE